jgi:hypothetical protein
VESSRTPEPSEVAVVRNDVHGSLLGAGRCAVDTDVFGDQLLVEVGADALVGVDQAARPNVADLTVVEVLFVWLGVGIWFGFLLGQPLVQGLVLAFPDQLGLTFWRRIALVQRILDPAVDEGRVRL